MSTAVVVWSVVQYKCPFCFKKQNGRYGAANRIRTGDLVLTKDVLYLLSHSSDLIIKRKSNYRFAFRKYGAGDRT